MNTTVTTVGGWEVRSRPYRNARTGIVSADEVSITAIHRANEWVLTIERATPERLASFDPAAIWANGATR